MYNKILAQNDGGIPGKLTVADAQGLTTGGLIWTTGCQKNMAGRRQYEVPDPPNRTGAEFPY